MVQGTFGQTQTGCRQSSIPLIEVEAGADDFGLETAQGQSQIADMLVAIAIFLDGLQALLPTQGQVVPLYDGAILGVGAGHLQQILEFADVAWKSIVVQLGEQIRCQPRQQALMLL